MTRMGKVLLTVLVLMLTCFLVIGAGSSEVKAQSPWKEIKIKVNTANGHIMDFCLVLPDQCKPMERVPPGDSPRLELRQSILFYSTNPKCIVMVIGGRAYQVCW